jgi:hypothetical protein
MKTLNLINKYFRIIEQDEQNPANATDATDVVAPTEVQPLTSEGEKLLIDLLIKAFAHSPDDNELTIIDTIQQQYLESNPKEVVAVIQKLLDGGKEELVSVMNKSF